MKRDRPLYTATTRILALQQQPSAAPVVAQPQGAAAGLEGAPAGVKNPAERHAVLPQIGSDTARSTERRDLTCVYRAAIAQDSCKPADEAFSLNASHDGSIPVDVDDEDLVHGAAVVTTSAAGWVRVTVVFRGRAQRKAAATADAAQRIGVLRTAFRRCAA